MLFCGKQFYKEKRHFNWNRKLGLNSFCSKKCGTQYRKTGKWLSCCNDNCHREFYKSLGDISTFNYCSSSCAAKVNNQKYPKWPKRFCVSCRKEFKNRSSRYCSNICGRLAISNSRSTQSKYTQGEIISVIKSFYIKYHRVPAKRELLELVSCATTKFGSWNNAVIEAGLTPHRSHNDRMYKRSKTKANDGHVCDSISEAIIDNWLAERKIIHERNASYPDTKHKADWAVRNGTVFLEYFGLANDSSRYDRAVKIKKSLCRKHKIRLIEIYPKDLYPKVLLDKKLGLIG